MSNLKVASQQPLPPGTVISTSKNNFDASKLKMPTTIAPQPNVETVPANWSISNTDEEGIIKAINRLSGREFHGTTQEFNVILRGEETA